MNLKFWKKKAPVDSEETEADDDRTVAVPRDAEAAEGEENSVRPGLLARLRNTLSALRKPRDSGTESGDKEADEADRTVAIPRQAETAEEHEEGSVRPGLFARLRNTLSALRKPRDSGAESGDEEEGTPSRHKPIASDRRDGEEPVVVPVRNLKKRLIIGGMLGALVLLLAGVGFATWKIFLSPTEQVSTAHAKTPQTEIEALKKKNLELQAQIAAIKKAQPKKQLHESLPTKTGEDSASESTSSSGEMTVSNKDPKAAAQALKAAIEEMNAASGGTSPRKPAP